MFGKADSFEKISDHDRRLLSPGRQLNDFALDAALELLRPLGGHVLIAEVGVVRLMFPTYLETTRFRAPRETHKEVIIPINIHNSSWATAHVHILDGTIEVYDPRHGANT